MNTAAVNIAHDIRKETSTRRAVEMVAALLAERDALEDLLIECLPYVEEASLRRMSETSKQTAKNLISQIRTITEE